MAPPIELDDSHWPLLIIRLRGVASDGQFEDYLSQLESSYLSRGEPYVSISDATWLGVPPAYQRHRQAAWLHRNDAALRARVLGHASIITSPFVRLSVSLLLHLKPLPHPHVAVSSMPSAVDWVTHRLQLGGLVSEAERIRRDLGLPDSRSDGAHPG
jgi:hypothetical protein